MISAYISHLVTLQQSCQRPSRQVRRNGACANHDVHRHVEASNAVRRGGCGYGLGFNIACDLKDWSHLDEIVHCSFNMSPEIPLRWTSL